MNTSLRARVPMRPGTGLRIWREQAPRARWLTGGSTVIAPSLLVWTPEEWAAMEGRPSDAQYHPSGVWCALRME